MRLTLRSDLAHQDVPGLDFGADGLIFLDGKSSPNTVSNYDAEADCTIRMKLKDFESLVSGDLDPTTAFMLGKLYQNSDSENARRMLDGPASLLGPFTEGGIKGAHILRLQSPGVDDLAGVLVAWGSKPAASDPALGALADALLVERRREDTRVDTEARLRGELIEELLAGEVVSRDSLVRRARHLGADLSGGAVALVGRLQDPHEDLRVITDPRLIRRFMQQTRGVLELHWPKALVDWHEGLLVVLQLGFQCHFGCWRSQFSYFCHWHL